MILTQVAFKFVLETWIARQRSQLQIFDGLRQLWQLHLFDLLGKVHVLDSRYGSRGSSRQAGLFFLDFILFLYPDQNLSHVSLQHHPTHHQLVQDEVDLDENRMVTHMQALFLGTCHPIHAT